MQERLRMRLLRVQSNRPHEWIDSTERPCTVFRGGADRRSDRGAPLTPPSLKTDRQSNMCRVLLNRHGSGRLGASECGGSMFARHLKALAGAALLPASACGGGGGGGSGGGGGGVVTPPAPTGPTWTQGVFQPASTFENRCATPRTGSDSQGRPFPDQAGTLAQELFWLRSWSNQTYLWNTEITDRNPATFSDRIAYFDTLKTNAITASGQPKDRFHYSLNTAEYIAQVTSAPAASYGAEIRVFAGSPPRDVRVLYTTAGTPATQLDAGQPKLAR